MQSRALIIGILLALVAVAGIAFVLRETFLPEEAVQGNATSTPSGEEDAVTIETGIGTGGSALSHRIIPLEVLEDSRCPIDVQCIQAGTVRVRTQLETGMGTAVQVFTLGEKITTETATIELFSVTPAPRAGVQIKSSDYRFYFKVMRRAPFTVQDGKG